MYYTWKSSLSEKEKVLKGVCDTSLRRIMLILDKYFFKKIIERINLEDTTVCVTSDHSTPCSLKAHSADPVPLLISGHNFEPDSVEKFDEFSVEKGSYGTLKGNEFMKEVLS